MQSKTELSATIREAMNKKNLQTEDLARSLGISLEMVDKLLGGEVVPSTHLEKQMIEVLAIPAPQAKQIAASRRKDTNSINSKEEEVKRAA